jgi:hypothetical protein
MINCVSTLSSTDHEMWSIYVCDVHQLAKNAASNLDKQQKIRRNLQKIIIMCLRKTVISFGLTLSCMKKCGGV